MSYTFYITKGMRKVFLRILVNGSIDVTPFSLSVYETLDDLCARYNHHGPKNFRNSIEGIISYHYIPGTIFWNTFKTECHINLRYLSETPIKGSKEYILTLTVYITR